MSEVTLGTILNYLPISSSGTSSSVLGKLIYIASLKRIQDTLARLMSITSGLGRAWERDTV
jgi:hypothetical protein